MNVHTMTHEQLVEHATRCDRCAKDDPTLLGELPTTSLAELQWFVATSHDPAWDPS
ncbi:hypothetical protein [Streptosporangium saharense]|uniref:hypothetical protein n=1 Tax=Streptosporangium saharense TaxID=1706840 RepID=UPI00343DC713